VIPLEEIVTARERLRGVIVRTPLVRFEVDADAEIYLKLETLQPVNSFKLRGAANAILGASEEAIAQGVVTASAGNMAQGVAYAARLRGVPARIVVPDGAPQTKLDAVERFGGTIVSLPYDQWWTVIMTGVYDDAPGVFIHPVDDDAVMAGNGTIGLELLEDLPDLDAVVVPYGGGGLITGIASAIKPHRAETRIVSVEPATGAVAAASHAAGQPVEVDYTRSFVDGAGSRAVMARVWEQAAPLIDDALSVTLDQAAAAIRLLAERTRVIAEGAGALALAAALSGEAGGGKIVCIVSGGNIDPAVLCTILAGETP